MLNLSHKSLEVWQLSIKLVSKIYEFTSSYPKDELFGLTSQTRRAAISIPANIAEGASRKSLTERKRFFEISRSSLVELDTHIEIALKLKYLDIELKNELDSNLNELFAKLSNLMERAK